MPPAAAALAGGAGGGVFSSVLGAATGVIPGIITAATGAGKSTYAANNFAEDRNFDPNKLEYGGKPGVADADAEKFALADQAYGAKANDLHNRGVGSIDLANQAIGASASAAEQGQLARGLGMEARDLNLESRDRQLESRDLNLQSRGLDMESRDLGLDARGRQGDVQNLMLDRAKGNNLIADRMAGAARNDLTSRMRSAAASARGPAGLANAQSDAMAAEAQGLGQINTNATIQGMQEQRENEGAAFGAASGMREGDAGMRAGDVNLRSGDTALQGSDAGIRQGDVALREGDHTLRGDDQASQDLSLRTGKAYGDIAGTEFTAGANAANTGLGYAGRQNDVRANQTTAGVQGTGILSNSHSAEQSINSGTNRDNARQDLENVDRITGAMKGGAEAGMKMSSTTPAPAAASPTPPLQTSRAGGGPVLRGQQVLVGEKGPEIIVPQTDGMVIPNHALGEDYRHRTAQSSMDLALGEKADEKRNMVKDFHRDTPKEQKATGAAYLAHQVQQLEAQIAGMKASLAQGASVHRDEGDADESPGWLSDYMQSQDDGPGDLRISAREEGGPVQAGKPVLVGEKGVEALSLMLPGTSSLVRAPIAVGSAAARWAVDREGGRQGPNRRTPNIPESGGARPDTDVRGKESLVEIGPAVMEGGPHVVEFGPATMEKPDPHVDFGPAVMEPGPTVEFGPAVMEPGPNRMQKLSEQVALLKAAIGRGRSVR